MGIIKDKLDLEWTEQVENEKMFHVRAQIEDLKNNIDNFFVNVADKYPTGDADFDNYVTPIKDAIVDFKALLETYVEFINWRQS